MTHKGHGADDMFIHEKLSQGQSSRQFRLLRILPAGNLADDIRCEIFHSSLDDHPVYEALSYTWGDPDVTLPICVANKRYDVTTNLECALRYIRLPDCDRIIWIDALCINQRDPLEKNHQVGQMRQIYMSAVQVLVWLGEQGDSELALNFLKGLKEDIEKKTYIYYGDNSQEEWDACYKLFYERPWWTRTWILQEALHETPVLVHIGPTVIELDELCARFRAYTFEDYYRKLSSTQVGSRNTDLERRSNILHTYDRAMETLARSSVARKRKHAEDLQFDNCFFEAARMVTDPPSLILDTRSGIKEGETYDLGTLLEVTRCQRASDPMDKVFALLGLAIDASELSISIDYTSSKQSLYTAVTRKCLHKSLRPLYMVESRDRSVSSSGDSASWVPDFTASQNSIATYMRIYSENASYSDRGSYLHDLGYEAAIHYSRLQKG
jgi:hypothetical protein